MFCFYVDEKQHEKCIASFSPGCIIQQNIGI